MVVDLLKRLTKNHIAKKSKTFNKEQIKRIVVACLESDDHRDRLMGVGVGVSFFGLLRKREVLMINCEDVALKGGKYDVSTTFCCKTGAQTVSFDLPEYMTSGMTAYLSKNPKKK